MKVFFKEVSVEVRDNKYVVMLDGKITKTPEQSVCLMPTLEMAEAIAKEWKDQEEVIDPNSMPLTKLLNTSVDRVEKRRDDLIEELVKFAGADQVCYRADYPPELVELQNKVWNPLMKTMEEDYGVDLRVVTGVVFAEQDQKALLKIRKLIEKVESFRLMALYTMITVTGSVTVGFNLFKGHIELNEAWDAGQLDENFQISQWGSDEEAEQRRRNLKSELENAFRFLQLCVPQKTS